MEIQKWYYFLPTSLGYSDNGKRNFKSRYKKACDIKEQVMLIAMRYGGILISEFDDAMSDKPEFLVVEIGYEDIKKARSANRIISEMYGMFGIQYSETPLFAYV